MAAITETWSNVADASVDPDAPITSSLMYALRDNAAYLREWLGASYTAGAVQDHNHDGANSALVEIGPNLLRNGSFESDLNNWTAVDYTGGGTDGSHAISTSQHAHGAQSLGITNTSTTIGGGYATSDAYMEVAEGVYYPWECWSWGSAANISSKAEILWYDNAQAAISTVTLYTTTATATAKTLRRGTTLAPANARYARIRVTGGIPGSGSGTGTVYFDGVVLNTVTPQAFPVAGTNYPTAAALTVAGSGNAASFTEQKNYLITQSGIYRTRLGILTSSVSWAAHGRIYKNGVALGTDRSTTSTSLVQFTEDLQLEKGDTVQLFCYGVGSINHSWGGIDFGVAATNTVEDVFHEVPTGVR